MQKGLYYGGLVAAGIAVVMAIAGLDANVNAASRTNPELAIAMAIVAFVLTRASENRPPS